MRPVKVVRARAPAGQKPATDAFGVDAASLHREAKDLNYDRTRVAVPSAVLRNR
jgi:hypothetical protein